MATRETKRLVQYLRRVALRQDGTALTDGQLLSSFIECRDEAAFVDLVRRHGPMVWGVCRRLLFNHHDAEDAFQATFLVLVRKAASVVPREMIANWLHGVAQQTAWKARTMTVRRKARERQVPNMPEPAVTEQDEWCDLRPLLDRELSRLPDKYRVAIILCDLEGKTRREAARQLGVPEGTLAARLRRGRIMLARHLSQQGLTVSCGALTALLAHSTASACMPVAMIRSTIKSAAALAAGRALSGGLVPATVAALTQGVLRSMFVAKLKVAVVVLLAAGALVFSVGTPGVPGTQASAGGDKKDVRRASPTHALAAAEGAKKDVRRIPPVHALPPAHVQVRIAGPAGMKVILLPLSKQRLPAAEIEAPGRLNLPQGTLFRLKLADIPNRPGLERFPTIEVPRTNAATEPFVSTTAVPIEFTNADFAHVDDGTAITKVIYLPSRAKGQLNTWHGEPITLASHEYPELDVIAEATRRGTVLAVVRMGNIDLEAREAGIQGRVLPDRTGKPVKIVLGDDGRAGRIERRHPSTAKADDRETLMTHLDRLMVELAKAQAENGALKKQLKDSTRSKVDILLNQVEHWMLLTARAQQKNDAMKKQLDEARAQIRSLQAALAERDTELRRLRKGKTKSE
jgi:RNA polymerase sigma factor (sigma-70 family)